MAKSTGENVHEELPNVHPKLSKLIDLLSSSNSYNDPNPKGSIMGFQDICDHDDGCLCECRMKFIIKYIEKHFDPKVK